MQSDGEMVKVGRRSGDEHCSQHELLWKHHDDERKDFRGHICGKIHGVDEEVTELRKDVKELAKSTTPWKVFALSMALLLGSVGWLATKIDKGQEEIKASVHQVHQRISANDKDVEQATKGLVESLRDLNYSVQSIDSRLKTVEKFVEARGK